MYVHRIGQGKISIYRPILTLFRILNQHKNSRNSSFPLRIRSIIFVRTKRTEGYAASERYNISYAIYAIYAINLHLAMDIMLWLRNRAIKTKFLLLVILTCYNFNSSFNLCFIHNFFQAIESVRIKNRIFLVFFLLKL